MAPKKILQQYSRFIWLSFTSLIIVLLLATFANATIPLIPNQQPITGEISQDKIDSYELKLEANDYMELVVEQQLSNLKVILLAPDGKQLYETDLLYPHQGAEKLVWIAQFSGNYQIQIQRGSEAGNPETGSYRVKVEQLRAARVQDRDRVSIWHRAEAESEAATALFGQSTESGYHQALAKANSSLQLWRELGEENLEAWTLLGIGTIQSKLGEVEQAIEIYEQARGKFQGLGLSAAVASSLESSGYAYFELGNREQSLIAFQQALQLFEQEGDRVAAARMNRTIGQVEQLEGNIRLALASFQEALKLAREAENREGEALLLGDIGDTYSRLGELQQALESSQQALQVYRGLENLGGEGQMLARLGEIYVDLGELELARNNSQEALEILEQSENIANAAAILEKVGNNYSDLGENETAISIYEKALQIYQQREDRAGMAIVFSRLGSAYKNLEQYQQAIDYYLQSLELWQDLGNIYSQASTWGIIAVTYRTQAERSLALAAYEKALVLYRQLGNRVLEARTIYAIGDVYDDLDQWQKALESYNLALEIANDLENKDLVSDVFKGIASANLKLGETETGLGYYEQSLAIKRQLNDSNGVAHLLFLLGGQYDSFGQTEKALLYLEEALAIREAEGNRREVASILSLIASTYENRSDYQKALSIFEQAWDILQGEVGSTQKKAQILSRIALVYISLNDYQLSLEHYEQALALYQSINYPIGEAHILNGIAEIYNYLGSASNSLKFYNQALTIYQTINEPESEARTLVDIGEVYSNIGDYQQGLDLYNQALEIQQKIGYFEGVANTLYSIADIYERLGDIERSINAYNQALEIFRTIGRDANVAFTLGQIGDFYLAQQDYASSLDYHQQARSLWQSLENNLEARALQNISFVYLQQKDYANALSFLEQAQSIYNIQGASPREKVVILLAKSTIYRQQEDYTQAISLIEQALPLIQDTGERVIEATTLFGLGKTHALAGNYPQSLKFYQQALTIQQELGDSAEEAETLLGIAQVKRKQGNLKSALANVETALEIVESLRSNLKSRDLRTSFFASKQQYYQFYIDLLMELHQQHPTQGYDSKALQASERARARSLLEMLIEANADIRQGVDEKLLAQEQDLQQKLEAIEQQRIQLLSSNHTDTQKANLEQYRQTILRQYQQIQEQISATSPRYAALTQPQPLSVAEIQQQVLDDNTLLLEYFLGKDRSYLWLVSKTEITSYQLPPQTEIEAAVRQFRRILTHRRASPQRVQTAANALCEILISPIASQLDKQRLLIVADSALQYIPFAALSLSSRSYQPLIIEHEIINLPSASTVAVMRQETANRPPAPRTLTIIADPVFSADDERVKNSNTHPNPSSKLPIASQQISRAASNAGINWTRLPGTRQEAEAILALLPHNETSSYVLDFEASRERATSPELAQYRIIHFATHGFVHSSAPELSGIVMSLVNSQGDSENGFLRLHDIFNLKLAADLVVLSACQTGLGEAIRGEGVMGLTRGLMYAGAQRIVTSFWNVDDRATANLMVKFYQGILQQNLTPSAALRQAQLQMWREQKFSRPYYWAAFSLQGEWEEK